jgi:hypothetical protein
MKTFVKILATFGMILGTFLVGLHLQAPADLMRASLNAGLVAVNAFILYRNFEG